MPRHSLYWGPLKRLAREKTLMSFHTKALFRYSATYMLVFLAGLAQAAAADNPFYFGINGGQTRVTSNSGQDYQDATSLGLKLGMRLYADKSYWTGTELVYTRTTAKESVSRSGATVSSYEANTLGLFLLGRTRGSVYVKGKIGAAKRVIEVDNSVSQDTTRAAAGIGIGIRQGRAALEFEYTQYGDDLTIFSVGYIF